MNIIPQVAEAMQTVLTTTADYAGRLTGFVKRERKLTGSGLVKTLVFGWLAKPSASLEELTQTAASLGISISPQGLDYRFTKEASECLKQTLEVAVGNLIGANPVAIPILQRFNSVYLQDSSIVVLPDELADIYQGCGGSREKNTQSSVKLQVRWNMNTGGLDGPYLQAGKVNDRGSIIQEKPLPFGALRIADLGYFSLKHLASLNTQGVYWLSLIFSQCIVIDQNEKTWDLVELLSAYCQDKLDLEIFLGLKEHMPCRLIAIRVPEEVAKERKRRIRADATRRGKTPPKRRLELANWTIVVTSVPSQLLSWNEAFVLLTIRWQIELLFKLWKSHGYLDDWRSEKPFRILCEV
ncbi:IS4 family transposase [Candidatus Poribacteria bacterium]|nr:IS4 family transposase [Candidatus Poribacteria bacterium]